MVRHCKQVWPPLSHSLNTDEKSSCHRRITITQTAARHYLPVFQSVSYRASKNPPFSVAVLVSKNRWTLMISILNKRGLGFRPAPSKAIALKSSPVVRGPSVRPQASVQKPQRPSGLVGLRCAALCLWSPTLRKNKQGWKTKVSQTETTVWSFSYFALKTTLEQKNLVEDYCTLTPVVTHMTTGSSVGWGILEVCDFETLILHPNHGLKP